MEEPITSSARPAILLVPFRKVPLSNTSKTAQAFVSIFSYALDQTEQWSCSGSGHMSDTVSCCRESRKVLQPRLPAKSRNIHKCKREKTTSAKFMYGPLVHLIDDRIDCTKLSGAMRSSNTSCAYNRLDFPKRTSAETPNSQFSSSQNLHKSHINMTTSFRLYNYTWPNRPHSLVFDFIITHLDIDKTNVLTSLSFVV